MRIIVLAGLLIACGSAPTPPAPAAPLLAKPGTASAPPRAPWPSFPGVPAGAAGDQLAWVLDAIVKRRGELERSELEAHFHESFLVKVPSDKLLEILGQLGAQLADLAIGDAQGTDAQLVAHGAASGTKLLITLVVDPASKKIAGFAIQRDDLPARPASFGEAFREVAALAPRAQFLVAALDNGACKPQQELAATDELAIGSTFKVYILLALADRIAAGKLQWTDEIAVRDVWKSLPSGITQNDPAGTKQSLAMLAERMISLSDNTAADHLLYTLGRTTVEAALRATNHARPALDAPFLSTRELFALKLGTPAAELDRYVKLPEARRRDYLDHKLASAAPGLDLAGTWKTARRIDTLEWFASAEDLCRAMAALWARGQDAKTARVLDILAKNPGLPLDPKVWPYVGFKGGSEPGVLNMTYLLRRDDNKWFVLVFGFNAAEGGALDDGTIYNLVAGAIDLAAAARYTPAP